MAPWRGACIAIVTRSERNGILASISLAGFSWQGAHAAGYPGSRDAHRTRAAVAGLRRTGGNRTRRRSVIPPRGRRVLAALRKAAVFVLINAVVLVVLFVLLEGTASTFFRLREIIRTPITPEHRHAEHDTLLGWVNLPDAYLPNAYGTGIDVRTNGQRFRNSRDFPAAVPPDRIRAICSGDSFTFGYGVANADAWCERLTRLDPRLETVNMGLGGYGVDQAYLWYTRDGRPLDHDIHLFVFLTADIYRMTSDRFMGYGKPVLTMEGDSLVVSNLPVPRTSWFTRRRALHANAISRLNAVAFVQGLLGLDPTPEEEARLTEERDRRLRPIVARIFTDLRIANEAKGSRLVLVYMPGERDYDSVEADAWRRFVKDEAARQGIDVLDLIEDIREVPPTEVHGMFRPDLHFTEDGNAWAAQVLHRGLAPLLDEIAARKGIAH